MSPRIVGTAVPDEHDGPSQSPVQGTDEGHRICSADVGGLQMEVLADLQVSQGQCERGDDVATVAAAPQRCKHKAAFVEKGDHSTVHQ